jgi:hypothetical protein
MKMELGKVYQQPPSGLIDVMTRPPGGSGRVRVASMVESPSGLLYEHPWAVGGKSEFET